MKRYVILFFLFSVSLFKGVDAQEIDESRVALELNYYGDFIMHPGLEVGLQYAILKREKFNFHGDFNLGGYWHKWNHNAYFAQTKLGARFTGKRGFFIDIGFGLGYMLTMANGDVYSSDENGEMSLSKKPINKHLAPIGSILFGFDFSKKKDNPVMFQCGFEAFWQSNVNQYPLPHLALKTGFIYNLRK